MKLLGNKKKTGSRPSSAPAVAMMEALEGRLMMSADALATAFDANAPGNSQFPTAAALNVGSQSWGDQATQDGVFQTKRTSTTSVLMAPRASRPVIQLTPVIVAPRPVVPPPAPVVTPTPVITPTPVAAPTYTPGTTKRALLISAGFDNDVAGIRSALTASIEGAWSASNITTITAATVSQVQAAISSLAAVSDSDDMAMVYFTCHGGQSYSAGAADEPDGQGGFLHMMNGDISDDTLGTWMSAFHTGQLLLVADACCSGELIDGTGDPGTLNNTLVMGACQSYQSSLGGSTYSVFTSYLIDALRGHVGVDANGNGYVSAEEAFAYADLMCNQNSTFDPVMSDRFAGQMELTRTGLGLMPSPAPAPTPAPIVDRAGNTLSEARNLGTLSRTTYRYSDAVGDSDPGDYYRFGLTSRSSLSLSLSGLSDDADLRLVDSQGNTLNISSHYGTATESITTTLNTGTYYVLVYRFSGNTDYSLSLTVSAAISGYRM